MFSDKHHAMQGLITMAALLFTFQRLHLHIGRIFCFKQLLDKGLERQGKEAERQGLDRIA